MAANRADRGVHDRGVSLVEQSIEGGAVPPRGDSDRRAQTSEVIAEVADAESRNLAGLELQREVSRPAGRHHVALAKPLPFPQRPGGPRKPFIITRHGRILPSGTYRRLTPSVSPRVSGAGRSSSA